MAPKKRVSIQTILKAMKKKYHAEASHEKFESFVALSRTMWRLENGLV